MTNAKEKTSERNARIVADAIESAKRKYAKGNHADVIKGALLHVMETAAKLPDNERKDIADALILHALAIDTGSMEENKAVSKKIH